jgi:Rod binding domain-containing protein
MSIDSIQLAAAQWNAIPKTAPPPLTAAASGDQAAVQQAFDAFIGETFHGQMLAAMRKSLGKPAYFHGGRAEEIFNSQLDQHLATQMSKATAGQFSSGLFELSALNRQT